MADRFPLIIDSAEEKIKELVSGDNLDLTVIVLRMLITFKLLSLLLPE